MTNHPSLRGHPITNSEVAQTAQQLPSVSMKLLNEARLELAIIIRDDIYQSSRLQELLYSEIPRPGRAGPRRAQPDPPRSLVGLPLRDVPRVRPAGEAMTCAHTTTRPAGSSITPRRASQPKLTMPTAGPTTGRMRSL